MLVNLRIRSYQRGVLAGACGLAGPDGGFWLCSEMRCAAKDLGLKMRGGVAKW
jgi:hypothetical protein